METLDSVLKIVIVHEDLITGIGAAAVLSRMTRLLESEFQIAGDAWWMDSNAWKFEMLRDPELREQTVAEAVAADVMIISICQEELPAYVRDWIECVLPMKMGRPAAMVALLNRENDSAGRPSRAEHYLRRLARQYGLDFFCSAGKPPRQSASGIETILAPCGGDAVIRSVSSPGLVPAMNRQSAVCGLNQ